jgi:hypothetical protein
VRNLQHLFYIAHLMRTRVALLFIVIIVLGVAGWGVFRFRARRNRLFQSASQLTNAATITTSYSWDAAVEKVKEARDDSLGGNLEVPFELKHYEERYWFLATQVAEIGKYNIHTCQDYLDLAAMIERHELLPVPALTDTYILFGVGQRADEDPFTTFEENEDNKEVQVDVTQLPEYQSLQKLAKSFNGRSFDLNNPSDRYALKVNMLSAVRPEALRIMEQVASAYHQQFARPLPVSSLIRPEQYQHSLKRVNRNAVTIDTPPHSTGLAFDIDYRYMSVAEQNFLMRELARLKDEGRIEVIRERNANFHVFSFINGARPSDDLITASLEKAGAPPPEEENHTEAKPAKAKHVKAKVTKPRKTRANTRTARKRRR